MNIALIGNEYCQQFPLLSYGGIETCVEQLAAGLASRGINFFVVVPQRSRSFFGRRSVPHYPFEVIEVPFVPSQQSGRKPAAFMDLVIRELKGRQFDMVWSQSQWSVSPLLTLNRPIICTMHDSCTRRADWLSNHPLAFYRYISKFQYAQWVTEPWQQQRSFQTYTGLAPEEYDFDPQWPRSNYLWVAGLNFGWEDKGLPQFIELARRNKALSFAAYGAGNQRLERRLRAVAQSLPNLDYGGSLQRGIVHRQAFKSARAFIFPTRLPETMGRTILESLSKGTPVIGSARGALPEMIGCGGVASNDFDTMEAALYGVYDHAACFAYAGQFSIDNEIDGLLARSQQIVQSGFCTEGAIR